MELESTRSAGKTVSFRNAVLDCMPRDGGLYVPAREEDLRPWVMYMDETTSFASIAGTLTSALLREEFSPVVSERIAAKAFAGISPELRQLDERLFSLELFHGPTGCHKDFGYRWLASALEHILVMEDRSAMVLASSSGPGGRSLAEAFAGKERLKTVIVYPRGTVSSLDPAILAENGGTILPLEIDGTLEDAQALVREVYSDPATVARLGLTLANTVNIGRLLPQVFFYMYAFTRLRKKVRGDIFYAVPSGNYGNLVAGLYAWKFSLPVNGFITDATASLSCDAAGRCTCANAGLPLNRRGFADPASPSNMERLEQVFSVNSAMLRGLVFPADVTQSGIEAAMCGFSGKYGVLIDRPAAAAWAAAENLKDRINSDEGSLVLVSKDHPGFDADMIRNVCGIAPELPHALTHGSSSNGSVTFPLRDGGRGLTRILEEFAAGRLPSR